MADTSDNSGKSSQLEQAPRQEIVKTAVNFLQNPTVQRSSSKYQRAFLKTKGLTEEEINIAFDKLNNILSEKKAINVNGHVSNVPSGSYVYHPQSSWAKFRDIANTIVLIGGLTYGAFVLYKKYIVPWLMGNTTKKSVEQRLCDIDAALTASVQELRDSLHNVHADLKLLQERDKSEMPATVKQVEELKADIASVKGLLLNRNQFALPVTKAPLTPPSIPAWQLSSATECAKDGDGDGGGQSNKVDADIEDICLSGSGSSETEMVTNNGSDSSLEMIRE